MYSHRITVCCGVEPGSKPITRIARHGEPAKLSWKWV